MEVHLPIICKSEAFAPFLASNVGMALRKSLHEIISSSFAIFASLDRMLFNLLVVNIEPSTIVNTGSSGDLICLVLTAQTQYAL